jgi:phospholipid/cholesterol/gamma-HCH transport system substrate-binding protein
MASYRKNIMVGITVLGGLIVLGWMIIKFGAAPAALFATPRMPVRFVTTQANGLDEGSVVLYRGVSVGTVTGVRRAPDEEHVWIDAEVDRDPPLPANVTGESRSVGLVGGGAAVDLVVSGDAPAGHLKANQQLTARFIGLDILPPQFAELATEMTKTAKQLRESNVIADLDKTINSTRAQVEKAGKMFDDMQSLVGDPKLRDDLHQSLENIRQTTESANRLSHKLEGVADEASTTVKAANATVAATHKHIDELAGQMTGRLAQASKILENFQSISAKVDQGKGTAGLLVNDPKLYSALVDTVRNLNLTVRDLQRIAEQWEHEGVTLKLGK